METLQEARLLEEPRAGRSVTLLLKVRAEKQRKRLRNGEPREYVVWRATIPREAAEKLGLDPEAGEELLVATLEVPDWPLLLLYHDPQTRRLWDRLPPEAKAKACSLGHAPEQLCRYYRTITVIAGEEELKRLGLEPGQPITLRELLKRARNTNNSNSQAATKQTKGL
ncbi:hypothetical protein [Pyrodictium abyssi]|uniref:SpoVT-AbrB domain-containing protein n=1 Tax=Pyrodictium abyssi TaxID=54256 RepID=A0ABM8J029_9CREN|nr:hypothetical protein PABY_23120 [Pyrodictium abyssi]